MTYETSAKPKRQTTPLTWAVAAVAGAALIGFLIYVLARRSDAAEYNRIVELVNAERYDEAVPALETFIAEAPDDMRQKGRALLARCYVALGDDPALSFQQSAEYYRKAQEQDPDSLTDAQRNMIGVGTRPAP